MNNKGWGLRVMLGFCLVIAICLLIVFVIYNKDLKEILGDNTNSTYVKENNNNKNNPTQEEKTYDYQGLLNSMVTGAKKYVSKYYSDNADVDLTINLTSIEKEGYITKIYDLKDTSIKCDGYVEVKNDNYTPYLKCGANYTTSGYQVSQ